MTKTIIKYLEYMFCIIFTKSFAKGLSSRKKKKNYWYFAKIVENWTLIATIGLVAGFANT
jgi:hypothetical protein